jgi:energy-coupling factor transport system permease protein
MAFSSDFYVSGNSWLHRMDPRVKLFMTAVMMLAALRMNTFFPVITMLALIHVLFLSAGIPKVKFAQVWKMMLPVMVMIFLMWPFFYREGVSLVKFWVVDITLGGLFQGITMALRICVLGFACFSLLFTTGEARIIRGLVKLGVPYKLGLMLAIALRYLPTFFGIIGMVTDAQKARGLELDKGPLFKRLKAYIPILVAVLITAFKTSDNLSNALEARGFGAQVFRRTYYCDIRMRTVDYVAAALILGAGVLSFWS